jgi:hypothetical protein
MDETGNTPSSTPGAIPMRAHRQRRKSGLLCVTIELRATEVTELIKRRFMKADARNDQRAVRNALHQHPPGELMCMDVMRNKDKSERCRTMG